MLGYTAYETKLIGILYKDNIDEKELRFLLDSYADLSDSYGYEESLPVLIYMEDTMEQIENKLDFGPLEKSVFDDFIGYRASVDAFLDSLYSSNRKLSETSYILIVNTINSMLTLREKLVNSYFGGEKV